MCRASRSASRPRGPRLRSWPARHPPSPRRVARTEARRRGRPRRGSWLERRSQFFRRVENPIAVARQRDDAADEAADRLAVCPRRPADDPDQGAVALIEYGPAGIAVADAEAAGFAELVRIDQAELLRAR